MIDKEQAIKYYKEYLNNGYNKTKAYLAVHPQCTYDSARALAIAFHRKILANVSVREFQEVLKESIEAGEVIAAIQKEMRNFEQRKDGIDHWLTITGYKEPEKSHIQTENITPKEKSILDKYIDSNRIAKDI